MKLIVTGREGQVVRSLLERAASQPDLEVVALGRPELDLAEPPTIEPALVAARPDVIVSAAAYTAVDKAEDEPDLAMRINGEAPGVIGAAAARLGVPVIHLSTDYVFAGDLDRPYVETDATGPQSVYGRTKLAGEQALAAALPQHIIMRTAWVYSPFGKNFVKTMLTLAETKEVLGVVDDQLGNPTSAFDIADAILAIVAKWRATVPGDFGLYHFAGTGDVTWCGFAREIMTHAAATGRPAARIDPITTQQFPTKAKRPANSRLNSERFVQTFGLGAHDWRRALEPVVERILGTVEKF
jgi:dTDP-4-dehydrorhamnose reductase